MGDQGMIYVAAVAGVGREGSEVVWGFTCAHVEVVVGNGHEQRRFAEVEQTPSTHTSRGQVARSCIKSTRGGVCSHGLHSDPHDADHWEHGLS